MIDKEKLKKEFEEKAEKLRNTNIKLDNNQKLKLYGLYKVATVGKYSEKNNDHMDKEMLNKKIEKLNKKIKDLEKSQNFIFNT